MWPVQGDLLHDRKWARVAKLLLGGSWVPLVAEAAAPATAHSMHWHSDYLNTSKTCWSMKILFVSLNIYCYMPKGHITHLTVKIIQLINIWGWPCNGNVWLFLPQGRYLLQCVQTFCWIRPTAIMVRALCCMSVISGIFAKVVYRFGVVES